MNGFYGQQYRTDNASDLPALPPLPDLSAIISPGKQPPAAPVQPAVPAAVTLDDWIAQENAEPPSFSGDDAPEQEERIFIGGTDTAVPPIYDNGIATPVPPIYDNGFETPVPPIFPGTPDVETPSPPIFPEIPPGMATSQVRFLHAAIYSVPYSISIGTRAVVNTLEYSEATHYIEVGDGFRTVTVMSANSPRQILYRANIPFRSGESMTLVIINTVSGIELLSVPDSKCSTSLQNLACYRVVNASYNSIPFDLMLFDGRMMFRDIRFKEITNYRRVRPGEYGFYLTATPEIVPYSNGMNQTDIETIQELPITVQDNYIPNYGNMTPLVTFHEVFRSGMQYTSFILGIGSFDYPYIITTLIH